jgi:hypothetical protein
LALRVLGRKVNPLHDAAIEGERARAAKDIDLAAG